MRWSLRRRDCQLPLPAGLHRQRFRLRLWKQGYGLGGRFRRDAAVLLFVARGEQRLGLRPIHWSQPYDAHAPRSP